MTKVNRLLADPEDLVCPILQSLMEHPVVAEEQFGLLDLGVRVYGLGFGD